MKAFYARLSLWALITMLVHIVVQEFVLPTEWSFFWAYPAHLLLWGLTIIEEVIAIRLNKNQPDKVGMFFMAAGVMKFLIGLIYLLPFLLKQEAITQPVALWFFLPYFSTLIFQAKETIALIQQRDSEL
jgi:hypothetical protein